MIIIVDKHTQVRDGLGIISLPRLDIYDLTINMHTLQLASFIIITDTETQQFRTIKDRRPDSADKLYDISYLGSYINDILLWYNKSRELNLTRVD